MHLGSLNLPELLLNLWRGTLQCDPSDDKATWDWAMTRLEGADLRSIWKTHGDAVAASQPYLPGFFDWPPCNPAEKINSGYKAKEYQTYFYVLGPAYFYNVLPEIFWKSYCKLVSAMRHAHQRCIPIDHLCQTHVLFLEFSMEFEILYYQRKTCQLHFCCPCVHLLSHICPSISYWGSLGMLAQWTMERLIGDLGREIRQPSNPYQNLAQWGIIRAQMNALKALIPDLECDDSAKLPRGARTFDNGYVLLRRVDARAQNFVDTPEGIALEAFGDYGGTDINISRIYRWGRLRLPNGLVACSKFKEQDMKAGVLSQVRRACNLLIDGKVEFAEVQFYFIQLDSRGTQIPYALVSLYGPPCMDIWQLSSKTIWKCTYQGDHGLHVVHVETILAVIGMVPFPEVDLDMGEQTLCEDSQEFFVVEKMGLDVMYLAKDINEETEGDAADL
ncbi:hypothetical protein FISHEDRAFT_42610 [Fistulina hepatica ATCC 64428]|uniref:Uncharacterized protein n=1 Tax=Fistulina hepatica ATCC 64428 TaxID=1128425 RepID=A0A0D7AG20_9AGAR|nr:hypothetical protein FISHEDRAFT_42610 [Fistulina hepatica ATCC 64428]